jgi:hypothetical protein
MDPPHATRRGLLQVRPLASVCSVSSRVRADRAILASWMFARKKNSYFGRVCLLASLSIVLAGAPFFTLEPSIMLSGSWLAWTFYGLIAAGVLGWAMGKVVAARQVAVTPHGDQNPMAEVVLVLNGMTPEMASVLAGADMLKAPESHRVALDVSSSGELINVQGGRIVKIVTPRAVEMLCDEQQEQLRTHAASLASTYVEWTKLYAKRGPSLFHLVLFHQMQRRIDRRLKQLAVGVSEPLNGVLSLLESFGLTPDDHYMYIRDLVLAAQTNHPLET